MKLEDFVAETIGQIINGIIKTHENAEKNGVVVNPKLDDTNIIFGEQTVQSCPPIHSVEFDVAVTTTAEQGTKEGIGIIIEPTGIGTKGKLESNNSSISRIKFTIPVIFPTQDAQN